MLVLFLGDFSWSFVPPLVYYFVFSIVSMFEMFFRVREIRLFFLSFTLLECSWPECFSRTRFQNHQSRGWQSEASRRTDVLHERCDRIAETDHLMRS